MLLRVAQFPKTREGDFPTKDEKCLASNGMTCLLPLSPYTPSPLFRLLKIKKKKVILTLRMILHLSISCNMKNMP